MTYRNAGHNAPFILDAAGRYRFLQAGGTLVGVFPDHEYVEEEARLEPGSVLVLYTDGIIEARNTQDLEFGIDRLIEFIRVNGPFDAAVLAEAVVRKVREDWLATDQEDDWTLLIVKRMGDTGFEPVTSTV